jgi:hypothetical protein
MNDGVKIILERMKTHPEEFEIGTESNLFHHPSKWAQLIEKYSSYLDPEDYKAYKDEINKVRQEEFTSKVMEELLAPKEEQLSLNLGGNATHSAGQTLASSLTQSKAWVTGTTLTANSNSLTIGNTTINESHLEHMKAHLEMAKKAEVKKEVKTIFGKLFNYS